MTLSPTWRRFAALGPERASFTLWLIFAGALAIRLWGIDYGLPFVYWVDEYHEVMRAMELGSGGFNWARTGKGGFYFLLLLEFGIYFVVLKVAGLVTTAQQFADHFVRDPSMFYLLGRSTAALFGAGTVVAAYWVARRAYGFSAGLVAGLFLAVNVVHIDLSHRVGVDVPMTLFATLALGFAWRLVEDGGRRDYVFAGLFAALAATTKLPGILVLVPLVIAHCYRMARTAGSPLQWISSRNLWLAAVVFIVVLAVSNPGIFIHFDPMSLYSSGRDAGGDIEAGSGESLSTFSRPNLYIYYANVLMESMGWPLFGFAILSAGYATWRHRPVDIVLLSYAVVNYIAISSTTSEVLFYPRYTLPIIVVLAILAGRALAELTQRLQLRGATSVVAATILVIWPASMALGNTYALTQTDTRTLAKQWFDQHVPAGSRVLIEGSKIAASRLSVPLADTPESLARRTTYWKTREPRQAKYLEIMRRVHPGGGYQLEFMQIGSIADLSEYVARGVEFVVVRPDHFMGSRRSKGDGMRLLNSLRTAPDAVMVKRFEAEAGRSLGPTIEVYRVRPAPPVGR